MRGPRPCRRVTARSRVHAINGGRVRGDFDPGGGMSFDDTTIPAEITDDERRRALGGVRIALAHDWLVGLRGGELVLDRLARLFGPTDLHVLVSDGRPLTAAIDACRVRTSPLQHLPGAAGALRRWYLPLYPWAVDRLQVEACDLLVSTHSAVIKSIRPPPGAVHLDYCFSPARYLWEQTADYAGGGTTGWLRRAGLSTMREAFARWDRRTADRVTRFVALSHHTAERIRRCWGREAEIVHPPVRTGFFTPDATTPREEFLLVVAALEPYKRTDLVIEAANRGRLPLKVVGSGSQLRSLRALAGPTVEMLGRVGDEQLRDLYRRARALVFPQLEDFGIVAVEALATGCPVVAYRAGGALDIVTESTGIFFERQTVEALQDALRQMETKTPAAEACRTRALRFSEAVFDRAMLQLAVELLASR